MVIRIFDRSDRGQTGIDFVVGMGVFLLAMVFVLAFIPSMFAPFFGMGVGDAIAVDRTAADLSENRLAEDPAIPGILNASTVDEFFATCDVETIESDLGLRTHNVNVTIDGNPDWRCGEAPGEGDTVARRVVSVDGEQHLLRVVVW